MSIDQQKRVCVVVLGDFGRSPRMQYHSLSLAREGVLVDVVAYTGSNPHHDVRSSENISCHLMNEPPDFKRYIPSFISYFLKVIWQLIVLFFMLWRQKKPNSVLVQNPPSIPTLPVVWLYCRLRRCKFVIDWHNYGFTIFRITLGERHVLVRMMKWIETTFGPKADEHFCVTKAMKNDLKNWNIKAIVHYDRPPEQFKEINLEEKHNLFCKLSEEYSVFRSSNHDDETCFTIRKNGGIALKDKRPAFLISSTSWTEDEDFSILLAALEEYESYISGGDLNLPDVICVVTGKGPLKEYYQDLIKSKSFQHINIVTPWLSSDDYPVMIGSADLGICLHYSSSGLDLPMKVVDMFGCFIPVCAVDYNCINELVKHGENGLVFKNSEELFQQIKTLLTCFPNDCKQLSNFKKSLKKFNDEKWHDCWLRNCKETFQ